MATAKKYKNYNNIDDLPATFPVKTLAEFLGINENTAYELAGRNDFPSLNINNRIVVVKQQFKSWLHIEGWKSEFVAKYRHLNKKDKKLYEDAFFEATDFVFEKLGGKINDSDRRKVRQFLNEAGRG